ncbi:MAG: ADP-ribosylglycohydrolase family protein [Victivallaceae bacterium]|nr:ADP-ribosylglycohydrolase family protein [Victivallaceae bacterium]
MNTDYREKIMGCWLGKAVGGTLGQPYEGVLGPLNLNFYNPIPDDMIPNDDLDLQVLWACILDKMAKPVIDRQIIAKAWLEHVDFPWDEYGVAIRNMRNGIMPPFSGSHDNYFIDGLGAAIRSELWANLAPGNPELAAKYAYEDACTDHAGDGIYAEMFLAAMESQAFISNSIEECIQVGLKVIPPTSRLRKALEATLIWSTASSNWLDVRNQILASYASDNFTDVMMNLPFILVALIFGQGDFSKSICIAVNCGRDADCTTATVGAFMGIINPESIEEKWLKPIGRKLVTNPEITGITHPDTLDGFTDMVISLKNRLNETPPPESTVKSFNNPIKFHAKIAYAYSKYLDNNMQFSTPPEAKYNDTISFTNYMAELPTSLIKNDQVLLLRFDFKLEAASEIMIMFNTPESCWIWVDDQFMFARECGRMAPSFHRAPVNQRQQVKLEAGSHTMTVALMATSGNAMLQWVMGLGQANSNQWLLNPFI